LNPEGRPSIQIASEPIIPFATIKNFNVRAKRAFGCYLIVDTEQWWPFIGKGNFLDEELKLEDDLIRRRPRDVIV